MKILIVEDNADSRVFLERYLKSQGCTVESAGNGIEALEKAKQSRPDMIISDIFMPEMDGFELCRRVKADEQFRPIPFIFYTATYVERKDEELAMSMGASRFIIKPMEQEDFFKVIKEVLKEHREKKIPLPDRSSADDKELAMMHAKTLTKKLDKKVHELQLFKEIFLNANDAIAIIDPEGFYIKQNSAHRALIGYSDDELRGKTLAIHLVEESFQNIVKKLSEQGVFCGELVSRTKAGKTLYIDLSAFPIANEKGKVTSYVNINRDITERKRAGDEIRKLSQAVEQSPVSIVITNTKGDIEYVNSYFTELTGYTHEESIGQNPRILKSGKQPAEVYKELWDTITSGNIWRGKLHNKKKNGKLYWEEATISPITNEKGEITNFIAIKEDITERKKAEEELQKHREHLKELVAKRTCDLNKSNEQLKAAVKELDSFSYSISHDLKAPLRAISGYSGMLREDYSGSLDEEGNRLLNVINDNAVQMGQLIEDILMYSRMARKPLERREIHIKKLAEGVILELKGEYKDRDIEFNVQEMPNCKGDSVMIKQVLMNLISNAVKFTSNKEKAEIEIGSRKVNGEEAYYIKDNGVGFDMKYADKLFGLFQKLHSTKEFEGTGVGLSIVQRLIHKHQGQIWAEAKVNEGATFYFSL